jgi:hypothetical protein
VFRGDWEGTIRTVAIKLEQLIIKEVSGVDDPANEIPGFMVLKSSDASTDSSADSTEAATTIVGKIKALLTGKEDIDMTKEELTSELDGRFAAINEKLTELTKSVEVPVEGTPADPVEPAAEVDAVDLLTAEDIAKAVQDGVTPILEIIEKTLDRIERIESSLTIRKSLDGQELNEDGTEVKAPDLSDAIKAALRPRSAA